MAGPIFVRCSTLVLNPSSTCPRSRPVVAVAVQFDPGFDAATVETRPSKAGNYLGVTITVTATSREQLDELYRTLSTHPMVKVVL